MKNKKLLGLGIGGAICICLASGFMIYNNNNEAMETMAMGEQKEEETLETLPLEAEENMDEKEQEEAGEAVEPKEEATVEPLETPPLEVEESVDKTEEEKETEKEADSTLESAGTNDEDTRPEEEIILEAIEEEESIPTPSYEIIPLESTTMYATQASNIRSGPSTDYEKVGSLSYAEAVTITGKVENEGKVWYVIDNEEIQMVSSSLLSDTKPQPVVQQSSNNSAPTTNTPAEGNTGNWQEKIAELGLPQGPDSSNIQWGAGIGDGHGAGGTDIQWE